jgi:hypothetical protein
MLSMVRRRMAKLETLAGRFCPECADWPAEIAIRIVEIIVGPGEVVPAPDPAERHPAEFGPCACCGRTHRARVLAIED